MQVYNKSTLLIPLGGVHQGKTVDIGPFAHIVQSYLILEVIS